MAVLRNAGFDPIAPTLSRSHAIRRSQLRRVLLGSVASLVASGGASSARAQGMYGTPPPPSDAAPTQLPAISVEGAERTSSRPKEFHLRALPEPCVTLSSHTAPDVRPVP